MICTAGGDQTCHSHCGRWRRREAYVATGARQERQALKTWGRSGEDMGKPWQTSQFLWFIMIFYDTGMNQNLSPMGSLILVYLVSYLSHSFFGQNHLEKAW
jgi:hypothetical protein